ncbi:MAG TPA: protocatechuate 3,4-dioxygenase subunit alpha [Terriglobales bacterium]|jgi:protocatechuate 3,4-dioxygenase alpha subunit|nr:protocatechuate 3,4-dioxygenase subunit alpha [Terriglobales bacterium]
MDLVPTPSQTVGPFFHFCLTTDKNCVACIAGPKVRGERVWLSIRVLDGNGEAINDAMIEIWQANSEGKYNHPDDPQPKPVEPEFLGFGRMGTAKDGSCEFETIKPGRVPGPEAVLQAPHLNVAVFARGMLKQLYTRIYFAGDAANREDPVFALVPAERRETLMAHPDPTHPGGWRFNVRLQGDDETVFFDV